MSTNCIFPPELDDKQLLTYLDDAAANQEIAHHLEKCPYCHARAVALARFQKQLTSRLYRSTCPSPLELGEYHLRMVPASQRLVIAQHVRECPYCQQELSKLDGFLSTIAPQQSTLEPIKVLIARLISGGAQMAVRGEAPTTQVFEVDDIVISLETQRTAQGDVSIQGLMAAENQAQWTGATVELQQDYLSPLLSYVDEFGGFSFTEIDPNATQVTITSPAGIIVQTEKVDLTK